MCMDIIIVVTASFLVNRLMKAHDERKTRKATRAQELFGPAPTPDTQPEPVFPSILIPQDPTQRMPAKNGEAAYDAQEGPVPITQPPAPGSRHPNRPLIPNVGDGDGFVPKDPPRYEERSYLQVHV